jgi:hypothetical protein
MFERKRKTKKVTSFLRKGCVLEGELMGNNDRLPSNDQTALQILRHCQITNQFPQYSLHREPASGGCGWKQWGFDTPIVT